VQVSVWREVRQMAQKILVEMVDDLDGGEALRRCRSDWMG
jgi:hypothetical protein